MTAPKKNTCAWRYGGVCDRPVSQASADSGKGCYDHGTDGLRSHGRDRGERGALDQREKRRPVGSWASPAVAAVVGEEEEWEPAWYEDVLERNDLDKCRAAWRTERPKGIGLAGVTFAKGKSAGGSDDLVIGVPVGADASLVASWALSRVYWGSRRFVRVVQGVQSTYPHWALAPEQSARAAALFGGREDVAAAWADAGRRMGLYTGEGGLDGHETDVPGLGPVACIGFGTGPVGAESAARRLLEAVDQGDGAAAARCADELAAALAPAQTWSGQQHAEDLAVGRALGYDNLGPRDKVAFLKTEMPDRADDLDRAAAIIGVGDYESPEAVPCAYLTAARKPCGNTTRSPDRWCGSCARRPAVCVAALPLIDVPAAPPSTYALHASLPVAGWAALLRRELATPAAADLHALAGYPPSATPLDPATLNVILDQGKITVTFPRRNDGTGQLRALGVCDRTDRRVVEELLRQHADPALLMSGRVCTRCDVLAADLQDWDRWGRIKHRTRRTRDDLGRATEAATPTLEYAVRSITDAILAEHGPVRDLRVTRLNDGTVWDGTLDVAWTDGPHTLRDEYATGTRYVQDVRAISPEATGMVALKRHLGSFDWAQPDEHPGALARCTDHPDKWGPEAAAAYPEIDPAWATRVAAHLGALHSGGMDLTAFLEDGGLTALEAVFGPATATHA